MSDWLISGWDLCSFVITPEEWKHCLAGFHCVIGNAHVPLDYHETPLEEYLDICHALYDRLMTGERLVWKRDYPLFCVQYLTTDLSRCGYGHIHEYQGERYKCPDFAEPCVSAAPFTLYPMTNREGRINVSTRVSYTPSAVTSQIKQLESELSIKLFEKIGRKMELTQAAREILPFIEAILSNVERLNNYKKDISEITGTLRLVAPDSIFIYNMQPIIKEILHTAPNIRLVVNSLPSNEINQAIVDGSADIGIDCDKGSFPESLVHKSLRSVASCLIASPFINPSETDFITPHQRKSFAMIGNEPKANYQTALAEYLDSRDIVLRPFMKFQSIEAVKRSVMNDLGIAYVPKFSVEDELKNGSLVQLKTDLDGRLYPSVCVYHKNKWISPQMKMALQIIEKHTSVDLV